MRGRIALIAALAAAGLATAGPAAADVGDLRYDGCLTTDADVRGCADLPGAFLLQPTDVAVSPDGRSVFVTAGLSNALARFVREPADGRLAFASCLANDGDAAGCGDLEGSGPNGPLGTPESVAVAPDGASVLVAASESEAVVSFASGAGSLAFDGCLAKEGTSVHCGDLEHSPIEGAAGVAVSPNGRSVYVTGRAADAVSHFFRDLPDGKIALDGCVANTGSTNPAGFCAEAPGGTLSAAADVAVSPDGTSVYVVAAGGSTIVHFLRAVPEGQITFKGCLNNDGKDGCTNLPGDALLGAHAVAISPDGRSVYVAARDSDALVHFARDVDDGELTFAGCLANEPDAQACAGLPGNPLNVVLDVAVSPDGRSVYTNASTESLGQFARSEVDGRLTYAGCFGDAEDNGCTELPGGPLGGRGLAVSPDGRSVYATGDDAVLRFTRSLGDDPAPGSGGGPVTPARATCHGKRATIVGTAGRDRIRGTRRADVIVALGGNDTVLARGGNDLVCGGAGNDRLNGGAGRDRLLGERGRDVLTGGRGRDRLLGGPGRDLTRQ